MEIRVREGARAHAIGDFGMPSARNLTSPGLALPQYLTPPHKLVHLQDALPSRDLLGLHHLHRSDHVAPSSLLVSIAISCFVSQRPSTPAKASSARPADTSPLTTEAKHCVA